MGMLHRVMRQAQLDPLHATALVSARAPQMPGNGILLRVENLDSTFAEMTTIMERRGPPAMRMQLVRLIKAFCPDFQSIRRILTSIGAVWIEQTEQSDYFFRLPIRPDAPASRRLKLRVENHQPRCLYYYDRAQGRSPLVTFQRVEMRDPVMQDLLVTALGIKTVVHTQREVWRTEHEIFNLDHVHEVGHIFEVELEVVDPEQPGPQVDYYRQLFQPYLETEIHGSNEELVAALLDKPGGDVTEWKPR